METTRRYAPTIRRRGFLALGGAGAAAGLLAACGTEAEEPSAERDVDRLSAALVGEENSVAALGLAADAASGAERGEIETLREQASRNASRLQDALSELDATAEGDFGGVDDGAGVDAALDAAVAETNRAVAALRLGAGQLSSEDLRATATELAADDGARLAELSLMLGENPAPYAFVTGESESPAEDTTVDEDEGSDDEGGAETTTETTPAEETTTSPEGGS
jgi:hypothetical protein